LKTKNDLIIVVLYKQSLAESLTLTTLTQCSDKLQDKMLYVWDNSPYRLDEEDILQLKDKFTKFTYHHCRDNKSLSETYNIIIKDVNFEKVFIFDQDTSLNEEYFELIEVGSSKYSNIGVFLPFVSHRNLIISPLNYNVVNFNRSATIATGITNAKNKTAFASGLCVKEWVFKNQNIWFDQYLNFYGVDYKFILDYGDLNKHFYVIDYQLCHSLSFTEEEAKEIKIKRFNSNIIASFYLATQRLNIFEKMIVYFRGFINSFLLSLKYMDFKFVRIFFKKSILLFRM
jgi:hypothetical protein